jgi:hypothetical protein
MLLRTVLAFGNLAAFITVILALREFPQLDTGPALYLILGWMVGSLVLLYGPWGNRPIGSLRTAAPSASPSFGPAPPLPPSGAAAEVPFCIYCAAPLSAGVPVCPSCGHRAPHL